LNSRARADTAWVTRLQIDQTVTLSLDEVDQVVECRVVAVEGPVNRLAHRTELSPAMVGRLVLGATGYLLSEQFSVPVGLRVAVRARPPYVDAALLDEIQVRERRGAGRVKLVTPARVKVSEGTAAAGDDGRDTYTLDVSESGALLRAVPELADAERFGVQLRFGVDPAPISARAQVARRLPDAVGVAFESISDDDAARLSGYLNGIRQRRRQR
jgi:hypothetical protein